MTSRLQIGAVPLYAVLLVALAACDDPVDDDRPAPLSAVEIAVDAPAVVQAGDSFDVAVALTNESSRRATRPVEVGICYVAVSPFFCDRAETAVPIEAMEPGEARDVTFRMAVAPAAVHFGEAGAIVACVREQSDSDAAHCTQSEIAVAPDVAALCDPPVLELPAEGIVTDFECFAAGVVAIDVEAGQEYEIEYFDATSVGLRIFTDDGVEHGRGSTPGGHWFVAEPTGRVYLVLTLGGYGFRITEVVS